MSTPARPYILGVGLHWDHPHVPAEIKERVRANLAERDKEYAEAGYDHATCFTGPEEGVAPLVESIKKRVPDGVMIGWGVRGNPELTVLFEDMVNAVQTHAPNCKLAFNTRPEDSLDAVKRVVPTKA